MDNIVELMAERSGLSVADIQGFAKRPFETLRELDELYLRNFLTDGWNAIEPWPIVSNWHIDAIADHLQAVSLGHIQRLLINVPPRSTKTTTACAMWPAWTWAQKKREGYRLLGPQVRWVFASYASPLALDGSVLCRRLIESEWYQRRWGDRFTLADDQDTKHKFDTSMGGARIATSVEGGIVGRGGDIFVIDDPHNTQQVESDVERATVIDWWKRTVQSRINDPKSGAFVVIMQRLHESDLSGYLLESAGSKWTNLILPMEYEPARHCRTIILPGTDDVWEDPRRDEEREDLGEGTLLQPARFDEDYIIDKKIDVGPYVYSGQYQQRPQPAGGNIFDRQWWQVWEHPTFPVFDLLLASVDTAYTEKTENDWSAFTLWGIFSDADGLPQVMLVYAWHVRLQLHELCQKIAATCKKYKVDKLLIEAKASGISVAQEMRRLFGDEPWGCETINPGTQDKVARAISVQPLFAPTINVAKDRKGKEISRTETLGVMWAPNKVWADDVIDECASFPKGKHDDYVDTVVQALKYLRSTGFAKRRQEHQSDLLREQANYQQPESMYEVT